MDLSPAAGFHLEGAAAAGDEATAAFPSVPLNVCGKLRKASQPCASRREIQGKSARPEQPNTEYSETSAAAILGGRWQAGEKHQQQLPTSVPRVDAALARPPEDSEPRNNLDVTHRRVCQSRGLASATSRECRGGA